MTETDSGQTHDAAATPVSDGTPTPARRARSRRRAATARPVPGAAAGLDVSLQDLREVPLLASLTDANLAKLARAILKQRAPAGEVLCREGDRGEQMYVILSGAVTLHKSVDGREAELGRLENGAYFGEMALIGDAPRTATIVAATDIEYLAIDRETLMRVVGSYPSVALEILKGYNTRLAETTQRLVELSCQEPPAPPAPEPPGPEEAYRQAVELAISHGPYPLATLVRKMQVEGDWDRKVLQALDVFEVVVKYTMMVLLADYVRRPEARTEEFDQAIVAAFRRPTLGQLVELAVKLLRSYAGREHELFVPELYTLYFTADGMRAPSARAFQLLTSYRNRLKHGAEGVRDEEVFKVDFEGEAVARPSGERRVGIKHLIATVLREVAFLEEYPLVHLSSMTYEHGVFQYGYERCTGAYPDFDHGVFVWSEPLENRQLYLLSRRDARVLRLDPLLRRVKCPECGRASIFLLFSYFPDRGPRADETQAESSSNRWREKLEYLSYACGHIYVDLLPADRIERGEGLTRLLCRPKGGPVSET
jgi:CRP/FNR family cyclic AMP-dependent transcriptional regulator